MDRASAELIERIDVYEEGLKSDVPDDETLQHLQTSLASLLTAVWEKTGDYFGGFTCVELTCSGLKKDHQYGDAVCDYEIAVRPKGDDQ